MSVFPEHYELIERIKAKDPELAALLEHSVWLKLLPYIHDWTRFYQDSLIHQLKERAWEDRTAGRIDAATEDYVIQLLRAAEQRIEGEMNDPLELEPSAWQKPD